MPLDPAYKEGSRGIKPVKDVWLEGIKPVFIQNTGVLWTSKVWIAWHVPVSIKNDRKTRRAHQAICMTCS